MDIYDLKKNANKLKARITESITRSCLEAKNNCRALNHDVQEPDLIAYLVKNLPHDLYMALDEYFEDDIFSVSGVFCHQKPIVDIKEKKKPELGDLLLVVVDENEYGDTTYNSLLLQAKIVDADKYKVCNDEQHQLKLYMDWPLFTYYRAGILNGEERNIMPKVSNAGAQYLLMRKPFNNGKFFGCSVPSNVLAFGDELSTAIVDLMKFTTGRSFEDYAKTPSKDDWTNMIWDLINISKVSYFNRRNSGLEGESRYHGEGGLLYYCSKSEEFIEPFFDDFFHKESDINYDEDRGVSVIIIESKKKYEYRRDQDYFRQ